MSDAQDPSINPKTKKPYSEKALLLKEVGFPPRTNEQRKMVCQSGKALSKKMLEAIPVLRKHKPENGNVFVTVPESSMKAVIKELCMMVEAQEEMLRTAFVHMKVLKTANERKPE